MQWMQGRPRPLMRIPRACRTRMSRWARMAQVPASQRMCSSRGAASQRAGRSRTPMKRSVMCRLMRLGRARAAGRRRRRGTKQTRKGSSWQVQVEAHSRRCPEVKPALILKGGDLSASGCNWWTFHSIQNVQSLVVHVGCIQTKTKLCMLRALSVCMSHSHVMGLEVWFITLPNKVIWHSSSLQLTLGKRLPRTGWNR